MAAPLPIELDSIGMADSLILMVLALVVFGPRRLPQIGRQIGKLMYEFRKASNDFKFQMEEELRISEEADRKKKEEALRQQQEQPLLAPPAEASAAIPEAETPIQEILPPRTSGPILQPPSDGEPVAASRSAEPAQQPELSANSSAEAVSQHG